MGLPLPLLRRSRRWTGLLPRREPSVAPCGVSGVVIHGSNATRLVEAGGISLGTGLGPLLLDAPSIATSML